MVIALATTQGWHVYTHVYTDHVVVCTNESDVHTSRNRHPGGTQLLDQGSTSLFYKEPDNKYRVGQSGVTVVHMETSAII